MSMNHKKNPPDALKEYNQTTLWLDLLHDCKNNNESTFSQKYTKFQGFKLTSEVKFI